MKLIAANPQNDQIRERFFKLVLGDNEGYVGVASKHRDTAAFKEAFFLYPTELPNLLLWVNEHIDHNNLYFCSQLLSKPKRLGANVKLCPNLWADLDEVDPSTIEPKPSAVLQSSPGRWQGFWILDEPAEPTSAESANRRLTYELGADKSGWDLSQLLRIPLTYNFKHGQHIVQLSSLRNKSFALQEFAALPEPQEGADLAEPIPEAEIKALPDAEEIYVRYRFRLPPGFRPMFENANVQDRSSILWALEAMCLEAGMSLAETYKVVDSSAVNKYREDARDPKDLWKEVCKAQLMIAERTRGKETYSIDNLLSVQEREKVETMPPSFIEKYVTWAKSRTDAAPAYHEAGAFVILSAILSGAVELEISFGKVRPNIWFMILGDTTLTRKTTAMEMALDLLNLVYEDALLATDGSVEGIMTALAGRPGRSSIFVRDEVAGLLDSMKRKDYLSGLVEGFSRWYEGKTDVRVLKKERIEVRDPRFIMFCGGIKSRIFELLDKDYIINGFIPRFLFVTADADVTAYRPPTLVTTEQQVVSSDLAEFLSRLHGDYDASQIMKIGTQEIATPKVWSVHMTQEALERYAEFERQLSVAGTYADEPELYSPTFDRMAKSGLKLSILFAASRQQPSDDGITLELDDILRAIYYIDKWKQHTIDVISNAGKGVSERTLERALKLIKNGKNTRSDVMRSMHLTSREADWIFETLEQRGLIIRTRSGKAEKLYPATAK